MKFVETPGYEFEIKKHLCFEPFIFFAYLQQSRPYERNASLRFDSLSTIIPFVLIFSTVVLPGNSIIVLENT